MLGILYQKGSLRRRIGVLAWRVCGNTAARVWWSDGTKHLSSSKACGVRQRGTAVVIVGWHFTHATQRQHGRDSGGAVAAAWGARATFVRIGPRSRISGRCPDGRRLRRVGKTRAKLCFDNFGRAEMASTLPEATAAKPRITWDEHGLATDAKERGVAYGTQKIDHPDTPYLYYDEEEPGHIRAHDSGGAPHCLGGEKVEVDALKRALGLVASADRKSVV